MLSECLAAGQQWSAAFLDATFDNLVDDNGNGPDANGNQNPPLLENNPDMATRITLAPGDKLVVLGNAY